MVEHLKVLSLTVEPAYASLTVEHLKVLMVEHLKVLLVEHLKVMAALTVEPAYASLTVEPLTDLMVEHLKVMAALTVEPAYASLSVEPAYAPLLVGCGNPPFHPYRSVAVTSVTRRSTPIGRLR